MRSFSLDERMKGDDELSSKGRRKLDANLLEEILRDAQVCEIEFAALSRMSQGQNTHQGHPCW